MMPFFSPVAVSGMPSWVTGMYLSGYTTTLRTCPIAPRVASHASQEKNGSCCISCNTCAQLQLNINGPRGDLNVHSTLLLYPNNIIVGVDIQRDSRPTAVVFQPALGTLVSWCRMKCVLCDPPFTAYPRQGRSANTKDGGAMSMASHHRTVRDRPRPRLICFEDRQASSQITKIALYNPRSTLVLQTTAFHLV
jgi:hypothetical protein